jgi:hypothetical protein
MLALVGGASVALAGCATLPVGDKRATVDLDASALRELAGGSVQVPTTVPVEIQSTYLDNTEARARKLLERVPPLGPEEIPNGVIRERVTRDREQARERLKQADEAWTRYQRLLELEWARRDARSVAATWAAIGTDLTRADVVAEADGLPREISAFRDRWRYVGDDPVRGVLVHELLEDRIRGATSLVERLGGPRRSRPDNVLDVGEAGGDVERVRTDVAGARHLYDQYTASLDRETTLASTFERARTRLVERARGRTRDRFGSDGDYPDPSSLVEADIDETPAVDVVSELMREILVEDDWDTDGDVPWLANDLTRAHEQLVRHHALDDVLARIEDGETFTVADVADVRAVRTDAVDAVRTSLGWSSDPTFTQRVGPVVARRVEFADNRLADLDTETVDSSRLDDPVSEYVVAAALAEATPTVSDSVERELRSA